MSIPITQIGEDKPFSIFQSGGCVVINGAVGDGDDDIVIGVQSAPNPNDPEGEFTDHFCIVSVIESETKRSNPNAVELIHLLADLLHYKLTKL